MSSKLEAALSSLPDELRNELINEYRGIQSSYFARQWSPAALSGGRFCEVVYSIINGAAIGSYPNNAAKPRNFQGACQRLEQETSLPRSFRILIPRILPALYEVRNNRGVGHVGGEVDSNFMDSAMVLSVSSWVVAELVRVIHSTSLENAQEIVSQLSSHQVPAVWVSDSIRRVLNPKTKLKDQILLLVGSLERAATIEELIHWIETSKPPSIKRVLRAMHDNRLVEFTDNEIQLLPPGLRELEVVLARENEI